MAVAAADEVVMLTAEAQSEMQRKNEIYLARKQNNGVPGSLEDLRLDYLNRGCSGASTVVSEGGVGVVEGRNASLENRSVVGDFYEYGFDPEFSFRVRFRKIGAGLENLGNTCYLNSVLQCLTYTEPFVAYLLSENHKSTCRKAGFCAMCALQDHVMDALQSTGKILRPFHLVKNLRCISSNFRNYRQEDAHEYMVNLLESMHKCCLPYGISSESPSAYEKSQVHKIFGGQLRSQVKCMQCSYCSNKFDPFLDLSLEIMKADSLRKALTHFTAMELLDGGERQFQCQRCKEKVMAFKQLTIQKAPYVLTIHLKRFDSSIDGEKLSKKVEYGPTLNLNPYISDPREGDYRYTLYGVLVHAGWTIYSGHYLCYVRTSTGKWYSLDDNQVTKVSEKTVLSREAYMLFYVRDRTLGVKGAVEVTPKLDISIPSATVHSSVQTKHDVIHSELVPAINASSQQSMKVEGLLFHVNDHFETKCLQAGDDICTNGHQTASSQELAKPLLSIDSQLPFDGDKKGNATDENAQDCASAHMMETDHSPLRDDLENSLRQPNSTNDFIQTEAVGTTLVDTQNNGPNGHEFESCSNNMQLGDNGDNFPKLLETKPDESFPSSTTVCCFQQEAHTDIITENLLYNSHRPKSKLKKLRKSSSIEGQYFGRKKLFLMSLHLPKNKQMRSRKHHLGSRKIFRKRIDDDPITDSHGASTSESFQTIDTCFSHLPRKHSRSSTHRKSKGRKKGIKLGSTSVHDEEFNGGMRTFMLEASNKSSRLCSTEGDDYSVKCKNAEDTDNRKFSANLQTKSLKQASVNVRDDENFSSKQMNEMEHNSKRMFGCLLDECDEEDYDKPERKRLKRSRPLCWGCWAENITVNSHLQNTAEEIRTKVKAKEPGNQPFRILT